MLKKSLKSKLNANQLTVGSWITIGHPTIAEILNNAGFDWLVIDLEHSTISIDQAGELIRTVDLAEGTPLVRLTSNDRDQIKRIMDAGAHGIVVPMVNSVEDAEMAVAATRYAPNGNRGVGLARAQGYGNTFRNYCHWLENEAVVIVQIEHVLAIECLEEILKVEGVDGFIIGPYDLSCSMGMPGEFDNPKFISAVEQICNIGKRMSSPIGLHLVEPDKGKLSDLIGQGYTFIAYSVDIRMLDVQARDGILEYVGEDL